VREGQLVTWGMSEDMSEGGSAGDMGDESERDNW
jgi:hypothetical protein